MDKQYVVSDDGTEKGTVIAETEEHCEVESCRGTVYIVEWGDGEVTECCSHGMTELENGDWKIN